MSKADFTFGSGARSGRGGPEGASTLDDPTLLASLVKSAKSAHSTVGRALDTSLSHQRFGGVEMEPSALQMNRLERDRQIRLQREMQLICDATHKRATALAKSDCAEATATPESAAGVTAMGSPPASKGHGATAVASQSTSAHQKSGVADAPCLFVPALPTMAPSMKAAADDGTEALGGTKIGGEDRGYVTLIGAVPTYATTRMIEDNYELVSSFRAYRTDALRTEQQTALRGISAPHPDLLQQLAQLVKPPPQYGEKDTRQHLLVDQETLPYRLRLLLQHQYASQETAADEEGCAATTADGSSPPPADGGTTSPRSGPKGGTWAFTCQGRPNMTHARHTAVPSERGVSEPQQRHLAGRRQPCLGQYHLRYSVVEPRVLGGYVAPQAPASHPQGGRSASVQGAGTVGSEGPHTLQVPGTINDNCGTLGQTQRDDMLNGTIFPGESQGVRTDSATRRGGDTHGRNIKGSSMFISESPRHIQHGTAAPDKFYWPYPDVRSTTRRVPCFLQLDVSESHRRREPLVSGVPASIYDVCGDIAANQPKTVAMDRTTGRGSHWYGRAATQPRGEPLDVEEALRATQPKAKVAILPPRTQLGSADADPAVARTVKDTSASVERNLAYPPSLIGEASQLSHIRDFGKVPSRADREARVMGGSRATASDGGAAKLGVSEDDDGDVNHVTQPRSRTAIINPLPAARQQPYATNVTELGDVPSLTLTKPRAGCTTDLGKGQVRPAQLLPLHDLTYDSEPGYVLTGPRIKGVPSISRTVSRQQVHTRASQEGCGAKVMYNPTGYLDPPVKSVSNFEKQITKEYEFRGHRVQSERYRKLFPSAPGPGHYTVNYAQVE